MRIRGASSVGSKNRSGFVAIDQLRTVDAERIAKRLGRIIRYIGCRVDRLPGDVLYLNVIDPLRSLRRRELRIQLSAVLSCQIEGYSRLCGEIRCGRDRK